MYVVTGAAGFIGSNLAHRLDARGATLWLVDHPLTPDKLPNLVGLESHRFSSHREFLDELPRQGDAVRGVFHLGACSSTTETNWDYLRENNLEYTQHLWRWCATAGRPFVYASSAATYGDGTLGFDDRLSPEALVPLNLYGKSKNDFDRWALAEVAAGGPTPRGWAGLKFFNVYGPGEAHKQGMASVVWHAYRQIAATGEVRLFRSTDPAIADGGQQRDFVFVDDCVDHMLWLAEHPAVCGLFNSGVGQARTFADLVRAVFAALGREPRIVYIDMPAQLVGKYQNFTQAEMGKLRQAGYQSPPTTLEQGVARYVAALQAGQAGCRPQAA